MSSVPDPLLPKPRATWREGFAVYLQRRVLIVLLLGFSSGLPLALSGSTLLVWMRESGVDLRTIGLFALIGTPYTLKFIWAPLVDALHVPFFTRRFGRRRGWLVFSQLLLIVTILLLALTDPVRSPLFVAIGALPEFLARKDAWAALAFVVLYKFTDAFSGTMTAPFVIDLGFSRNDYAAIVKGVGLAATLIGGFAGGFVARTYSLPSSLWIGGVLQAVANLSFSWLALVGVNQWALAFAITAENFTSAIGTVIFVAYLSALCRNPLHTATQYALLTALAAVGRTYLSSGAGYVAKATGWPVFFAICVVVAVPSLMLLAWLQRRGHFAALESKKI